MEQSTRGLSTFKYEDKKQSQKHYPVILQSHYEIFASPDLVIREGADQDESPLLQLVLYKLQNQRF